MILFKQVTIGLIICSLSVREARAQLWRYLNNSPESEKAYENTIEKEACSIVIKNIVVDSTEFSYKIISYPVQSFDNVPNNISVVEKPFSHKLNIISPNDSLVIYDFHSLAKVHILAKDLLEIVYSPRGGSDQGYDNVLILGLDKSKFCIVMEIQSINEFALADEYGLYNLRLKLIRQNIHNYQMSVNIRDLLRSNTNRLKSYDKRSHYILKFDEKRKIFYSDFKSINAMVDIWEPIANKTTQRQLTGNYPMIKLGILEYYYIDNAWYAGRKDVTSGKYSFVAYCRRLNP